MLAYAGIAQLVERNLAKVEVASSNLVSRSKLEKGGYCFPFLSKSWRDSKAVMHRIANPLSPVRLWVAPPDFFFEINKIAPWRGFLFCPTLVVNALLDRVWTK